MKLTRTSQLSGQENTREVDVTLQQLAEWERSGQHIQNALPHLSADDREFILTGSTPEEWEAAFGNEEDNGE